VRIKDEGQWQGRLQNDLGMTLSRQLSERLGLVEGDILALSAGDSTQAVSICNPEIFICLSASRK